MTEGTRLEVGQLGIEHHGWYVKLDALPGDYHPQYVILGGIRRWTYNGQARVGVLDTSSKAPGITGTEYHRSAGDMCTLERCVVKTKPRVKQYDDRGE